MSDDVRFETLTYGPQLLAAAPLVIALVLVVVAVRRLPLRRVGWLLPIVALQLATGAWYLLGIGANSPVQLIVFCATSALAGLVTVLGTRLRPPAWLLLPLATACATLALELTWNEKAYTIAPQFWLIELALVGGAACALWLVSGRRGVLVGILVLACTVVGLIQHYVLEFRGTSVLPSDILALGTAISVSGGYTYDLSASMLLGFSACAAGLAVSSLLAGARGKHVPAPTGAAHAAQPAVPKRGHLLRDLAVAAAIVAAMAALVLVPSYGAVFGANIDYWWSKDWYERQGFLPSFVYACQDVKIKQPDGYTPEAAQEAEQALTERYAQDEATQARRAAATEQFAATTPNVIVIQNETFCDLSTFAELANGYTGPAYWNGIPDALAYGDLAVSVFGGGTCNTEFEFLTGNSLAFVGTAKYPFTMYDLSEVPSLPRQLAAQGYRTVGMHPNIASNWNRDRAYEQLGFDEFLSIDDFAGAEEYHTHVSDWATYDRSLELMRSSDEPVFVFDVTMQNHSGYDTGSIPQDQLRGYAIEGLSPEDTFQLNEFLACIDESDRALQRLMDELRALGEPTVVVMYGDHHPWFSEAINDLLFPNEDALEHAERIHNTSYVLWANYAVAGAPRGATDGSQGEDVRSNTSADLLCATMLDLMGAPLSDFQTAQLGMRRDVKAINADGYRTADGAWHALDDSLRDLELVEYLNFGSTV